MASTADALVEAMRSEFAARTGVVAPSAAWGVFTRDGLVHAEGSGDAARRPADSAFRIASCTKSFTAAAALLLARDGALNLEEPLAEALDVPLRIIDDGASSERPPTVRDALSMQAGFPSDDPWADRQESLTGAAFARMLGEGVRTQWAAGTRYEYSNLGFAIVGRIIALRAGRPYRAVVRERLLEPLGLSSTGFTASVPAPGGVVPGFRRGPDGWEPCPYGSPGAFSPIGGLFSTVADLARWAGAIADPASTGGVLPEAVAAGLGEPRPLISGEPGSGPWSAYGMGLVVREDGRGSRFLGHSGGYPGFGAHVQWHADSGVGAVAFENATYAGPAVPLRAALDRAFGADGGTAAAREHLPLPPWDATTDAAAAVRSAIVRGDLGSLELESLDVWDECVAQDSPFDRRAAELRNRIERIGGIRSMWEVASDAPAQARWRVEGPGGAFGVELTLTPRAAPRIQSLRLVDEPTT